MSYVDSLEDVFDRSICSGMFHGNLKRFKVESELSGRIGSQITGLQTLNRFVKEKKQPREIKANLAGVDVFLVHGCRRRSDVRGASRKLSEYVVNRVSSRL